VVFVEPMEKPLIDTGDKTRHRIGHEIPVRSRDIAPLFL
jgi:hypothetical protein